MVHHPARTSTPPPNEPPGVATRATARPSGRSSPSASTGRCLGASVLSWVGDYLAKAAVTALVYQQTESAGCAAAAFAISYLPWLLLRAAAGRARRAVSVPHGHDRLRPGPDGADRAGRAARPADPGHDRPALPHRAGQPALEAARSALLPLILTGDRLVVGLSLQHQRRPGRPGRRLPGRRPCWPRSTRALALLLDAATFAVSALLLRSVVQAPPGGDQPSARRNLLRETAEGFRLVFGTPALRAIALLVFAAMLFAIVPEGLAAAWARQPDAGRGLRARPRPGPDHGSPARSASCSAAIVGRPVHGPHRRRRRLIRPLAVLAPADPGAGAAQPAADRGRA